MSEPRHEWEDRVGKLGPVVGFGVLAVCGLYALVSPADVLRAYAIAFAYWWTLAIGGLALAALHQLVSGRWGLLASRSFEATARTLPFVGLMFLPLLLAPGLVWPWVGADDLGNKGAILNVPFLAGSAATLFVVWTLLSMLITWGSVKRDREPKRGQREALIKLGAGTIVVFVLTVSFASIEWFMSLEPDWFSTIYGGLFVVDAGLTALALAIIVVWLRCGDEPASAHRVPKEAAEYAIPAMWGDLGNLLLAFTMVWAYFNFSQFIIIWSADLPLESIWYLKRVEGGWLFWANAVALLHFVLPFVVLLSPDVRSSPRQLARVSACVLVVHFIGVFWTLAPAFGEGQWGTWILAWPVWIGLGGVWLGLFSWQLGRHPLLPANDPAAERLRRLAENGHGAHGHTHGTEQTEATA